MDNNEHQNFGVIEPWGSLGSLGGEDPPHSFEVYYRYSIQGQFYYSVKHLFLFILL